MMSAEWGVPGTIFDIRRFSVHDGQGIRTTVFLKGCPLNCRWCQNPEGLDFASRPVWFEQKCIHCRACTQAAEAYHSSPLCWDHDRLLINDSPFIDDPALFQLPMRLCPTRALVWDSRRVSVGELITELEKDRVFFNHGGGVTLSGGEPLAQPEFTLALLAACRGAGFHTAIETSLFAPAEIVDAAADVSDTIIADCKIFDNERHQEATGQGNALILENLSRLLSGPHASRVLVRTPLIPGFTADDENIGAISAFISGVYADTAYELLNYNPLAAGKYSLTGRKYCFTVNPKPFSAEAMLRFRGVAEKNGILNMKEAL
ncbi:MAG: glycyl-radical enzyme activating protein [Spirochaetaceae bacterium]|jgi:pyruvate formate lyase activating enzyme|nr:glycyl-radical enzyme activating protein [Spirochaetaceae bacterium]